MPQLTEFDKEKRAGVRIVAYQIVSVLAVCAIAYCISGSWRVASAMLWGGATAALSAICLVAGLSQIEKIQSRRPHELLRAMYRNSMERFIVVIALLLVAMGWFKLSAAAVLCGFVFGQVVPILARILMIKR